MSARTIAARVVVSSIFSARSVALLVLAAAQVWCASNEDASPEPGPELDAGIDSATKDSSHDEETGAVDPSSCSPSFCRVPLPTSDTVMLDGVWAKSASDVWVVGAVGFAAHFDGSQWTRIATGTKQTFFAVAGSDDGTVWGASSGDAFFVLNRATDAGVASFDAGFKGIVTGIAAYGSAEAYAVGIPSEGFPPPPPDNIWHFGPGPDGTAARWEPVSPPCPRNGTKANCAKLRAVWIENEQTQWFAGDEGRIYRSAASDGGSTSDGGADAGEIGDAAAPRPRMSLVEMNSSALRKLNALWGFNGNDVWAVGVQGMIRHFTGGEGFDVVPSPVTDDLYGVWGSRPDDVWAVGEHGVVLHWDGKTWSVEETPFGQENRPRLYAVSGAVTGSGRDVWIVGENTLLRSVPSDRDAIGGDR